MKSIARIAERVERTLNETVGYEMTRPIVVAVKATPNKVELTPMENVVSQDIYDVLDSDEVAEFVRGRQYFAIVTTGWAAPISDESDEPETAPSRHPERRRVRLTIVASPKGVASVLRFQDAPDDTVIDEGAARGSLNDAVRSLADTMSDI